MDSQGGAEPGPARVAVGADGSRRILVVEDHDDARRLMQRLLQMWGYDVVTAPDGPTALTAAAAHRPDVALVDVGLPPGMDGYEVARRLRAELGAGIRLVALTGYAEPEDRDRSAEAGLEIHLLKPI